MSLVRRLAVLAGVVVAAAFWSGSALAIPPVNLTAPTISGSAREGWRLTADPGTWTGASPPLAYQWQQCAAPPAPLVCSDIVGATSLLYSPTTADVGKKLRIVETATNVDGSTAAMSDPTATVVSTSRLLTAGGHFIVHYQSAAGTADAITETQAGDIGALAERAYAAELADGYPAPLSDGTLGNGPGDTGSHIDIYVDALPAGVLGVAQPDIWTSPAYGYIELNGADPVEGLDQHTIAHELFHLIQFGIWLPSQVSDYWLLEGSAEWMGYKVDNFSYGPVATSYSLGNWDMVLDCRDPLGTNKCDLSSDYKNNGYSRWPFFEYAAERWGGGFLKSVFDQGAAGAGSATTALSNAIAAKGSSLADTFTDWTVANMTGSYQVANLQVLVPPAYSTIATGKTSGKLPAVSVPVNHLSARYVAIQRGDGAAADGPCYVASLTLNVGLPVTGARPYFWWSQKSKTGTMQQAQALTVNGTTASITVPWDTCNWGTTLGYLSLPNPSTDLAHDSADFTISGTITVDRSTQATATPPPDPVKQHGPTLDSAPAAGDVPQISVFGPQVLRIASDAKTLRLIVSSDGSGKLKAALGSLQLGTKPLRAGGNDLRFTLPKTALKTIRRTSAAADVLTLTPLSSAGAAGKSVTRRVVVQTATKVTAGARR